MMNLGNGSNGSVNSKDKELPPIPPPKDHQISSPLSLKSIHSNASVHSNTSIHSQTSNQSNDDSILQFKSLKRKNFKKLSLNNQDDLHSPALAGQIPQPDDTGSSANCLDELKKFETSSLRTKRGNIRAAPLLNLNNSNHHLSSLHSNSSNSSISNLNVNSSFQYNTPGSNRSSLSSNASINIAQSQRHIDPDSVSSTENIINQFSNLELNQLSTGTTTTSTNGSHPSINNSNSINTSNPHKHKFVRKPQTVISSISPTKSNSSMSSPKEPTSASTTGSINTRGTTNTSVSNADDTDGEEYKSSPVVSTTSTIKFNNKDLVTLKDLGSGNSGNVLKILHIPTQKIMAKKIIPIELKLIIQNQIIRELKILHECQSPYIIEFYGAFINKNTIVICMEYCNCGSLDKILSLVKPNQFPLPVLKKLTYSILSGLVYLYETHKIIHRDIKPSNVLMTHKGQFKLGDFGVSRELTNSLAVADTFVGTSTYMSPERIQGLEYGIKSDIWSMGLMLIELATGKSIWHDDNQSYSYDDEDNDKTILPKGHSHNGSGSYQGPEGILDLLQRIVNEEPPHLNNKISLVTKEPYDPELCKFIDYCLIKDDKARKSPWDLMSSDLECGFLADVNDGGLDKQVKSWAKNIRKLHKDKNES